MTKVVRVEDLEKWWEGNPVMFGLKFPELPILDLDEILDGLKKDYKYNSSREEYDRIVFNSALEAVRAKVKG